MTTEPWPETRVVLRALREARGVSQEGWAALLHLSAPTIRRWESGAAVPTAEAEEGIITLCRERGMFRSYQSGPLAGVVLTAEWLSGLLAEARVGTRGAAPSDGVNRSVLTDTGTLPLPAGPGTGEGTRVGPAPTVTPINLPAPLTSFVGRAEELAELAARLGSARLLTLTGAGGCGKTRLALEAARRAVTDFPDGVYLVELAPLADPTLVLPAIAQTLGVHQQPDQPLVECVKTGLHDRRTLLFLDNFEHLLPAAPVVTELLRSCPGLVVLTTSREKLHLYGEHEYLVTPLAVPDPARLPPAEVLRAYPSIALFCERAVAVDPAFTLSRDTAPAVAEVCAYLDGLPLAIELAAALARVLPPVALRERLATDLPGAALRLLVGGARDLPARQRTLRDTFAWSEMSLDEETRTLFRRLAVFVGGWTAEAAEWVCGEGQQRGEIPVGESGETVDWEARGRLDRLVNRSLVQIEMRSGGGRYRMLEPVREYAAEQLALAGEVDQLRLRHAAYFTGLAGAARAGLWGTGQQRWLTRLDAELENVRAALRWYQARDDGAERGLRLAAALGRFWQMRGYFGEGRSWLAAGLGATGSVGAETRTEALLAAGLLARRQGDYAAARAHGEEALALARERVDRRQMATALLNLGHLAQRRGEHAQSRSLAAEARTLAEAAGDRAAMAESAYLLGLVAREVSDYSAARGHVEESLAICQEFGDRPGIADGLNSLGFVAAEEGNFAVARACLEESLAIRRQMNDRAQVAGTLTNLGQVALLQRRIDESRTLQEEALAVHRELGDRRGMSATLLNLGTAVRRQGDWAVAADLFEQALVLAREMNERRGISIILQQLGHHARMHGAYDEAYERYTECLAIGRELGDPSMTAFVLMFLGRMATERGAFEDASKLLAEALTNWRSINQQMGIGYALEAFGVLTVRQGRPEQGTRLLGASEALLDAIDAIDVHTSLSPSDQVARARAVQECRDALGPDSFAAAWEDGRTLTPDEALTLVDHLVRGSVTGAAPASTGDPI